MSFCKTRLSKKIFIFAASLLFLVIVIIGKVYVDRPGEQPAAPAQQSARGLRIQRETGRLVREIYSCGHERLIAGQFAEQQIGMDRAAFEKEVTGYQIEEFGVKQVILARRQALLCDSCKSGEFIGILNGYVSVFAGTPQKPGPMLEATRIPVARLPQSERLKLKNGIPVKDVGERLQILEGLSEYMERE
ncbi:MAG TPA: hypothetical protein DER58_06940 [Firmicutes bacterium]|jgi:hypothetical protein|nr:hypothetical protein [Bacillota bacterium]HBL67330.1 hypothetical protein [Bacillota bacterium]HCF92186.1 hypothetical protein [Bacillota bacterium]